MIIQPWREMKKRERITRLCDSCGQYDTVSVQSLRQYGREDKCSSCTKSEYHSQKKYSNETKTKISKSKQGQNTGPRPHDIIEKYYMGSNNAFYGKKHTQESIDRAMETRSNNPDYEKNYRTSLLTRDNAGGGLKHRGKKPSHPKRTKWIIGSTMFRSSWEYGFAKHLEDQGKDWIYEPETLLINNGFGYTPDFLCDGVYYEIKGGYHGGDEKFQEAKILNPDKQFVIFWKKDMIAMKILTSSNKLVRLNGKLFPADHEESYDNYKKLKLIEKGE